MKIKLLLISFILFNLNINSQTSRQESWSFGAGISNFMMNGDLKAKSSLINIGAYGYADKMLSPSVGFEFKLGYSKLSGQGNDASFMANNHPLDKLKFEGSSTFFETNVIYNLSTIFNQLHKKDNRKFNFSVLFGLGFHTYNSKLYNTENNELLADFGNGPSKNGTTSSLYYTSGLNIKYKLKPNLELEFRQNININEEDHLDATVSNKSSIDYFFKSNIGIVYTLNKKEHKNFAWYNQQDVIVEDTTSDVVSTDEGELDDDNDGVINKYDRSKNTPKGAIVYGNGFAIDSDDDGVIDLYDKCPLKYAKTKTGCKEDIDTDNDGIIDRLDECPTLFGKTANGCPKEKNIVQEKPIIKELSEEEKHKQQLIAEVNKNNTKHANKVLDNSVNISDVDTSPIFPGCENLSAKFDTTNCIISSISRYVDINYNLNIAKSINGKVRVLFIIDEQGNTKVIDILGEYPTIAKDELKRVLESLPNVQPGTLKGVTVPVKYSLLFILK